MSVKCVGVAAGAGKAWTVQEVGGKACWPSPLYPFSYLPISLSLLSGDLLRFGYCNL